MPTYQYRCSECSSELEAVQKFTDAALTECPSCQGELKKVYGNVGVVFKGSGFYATDSRSSKQTGSSAAKSDSGSTSDSSTSKDAGSSSGSDSGSTGTPATPASSTKSGTSETAA